MSQQQASVPALLLERIMLTQLAARRFSKNSPAIDPLGFIDRLDLNR
jgi:hypothetical protein